MTFNETGHGMYVSKEFEIQRVNIGVSSCDGNDETDGPSSVNIYPSTFVPHSDPLIPKSTLRNTSDRSSWCECTNNYGYDYLLMIDLYILVELSIINLCLNKA